MSYVLLEGPTAPLDWGTSDLSGKRKSTYFFQKAVDLISYYEPSTLVLEGCRGRRPRRPERGRLLLNRITRAAKHKGIDVRRYRKAQVREVFEIFGVRSKYSIARKIGEWLPQFESILPRYRMPWMSEDHRMGIFEALSLLFVHYYLT